MRIKRTLPLLLSAAVLGTAILATAAVPKQTQTASSATAGEATPSQAENEEMRGIWVTYMDLSMENESDQSAAAFRAKFTEIAKRSKRLGFNTLVVQVRPFCDALYKSDYFPYSHILTGIQGKNPGYDALEIMCRVCRATGLKIHAWINPYRVRTAETPPELAGKTPSRGLTIETESGVILDPSADKARKLIVNGVREIAENYDVDGIQFDDYFYPEDTGDADSRQYREYADKCSGKVMNLETWRTLNVNLLISECYMAVHESGREIEFGISPQGNLGNNSKLCADVESWCCVRGFVDYICPQIYFSPTNPALGFNDALNDWKSLKFADGVKLYAGLAGYKAGTDADSGTWEDSDTILAGEYAVCRNETDGVMLFSYGSTKDDNSIKEILNLSKSFD